MQRRKKCSARLEGGAYPRGSAAFGSIESAMFHLDSEHCASQLRLDPATEGLRARKKNMPYSSYDEKSDARVTRVASPSNYVGQPTTGPAPHRPPKLLWFRLTVLAPV